MGRGVPEKFVDKVVGGPRSGAKFEIPRFSRNIAAGDPSRVLKSQNFFADAISMPCGAVVVISDCIWLVETV